VNLLRRFLDRRHQRWEAQAHARHFGYDKADKKCPDCGCKLFYRGPQGGAALNVKCASCGAFWWFALPFEMKKIESDDRYYNFGRTYKLEDL